MLRKRDNPNKTRPKDAAENDIGGIDIPWPIWLFFALMFALVPLAEKPQPLSAEEIRYARQ